MYLQAWGGFASILTAFCKYAGGDSVTVELSYIDCRDFKKSARLMMQGRKERAMSEDDLRYMTGVFLTLCQQNLKLSKRELKLVDNALGAILRSD